MTTKCDLVWTTFIAQLRQDLRADAVTWRHEKGRTVLMAHGSAFVVTDADLFERLDETLDYALAWLDGVV